MVRDNFKPTLFLNKALSYYPPSTKSEVVSSSPYLRYIWGLDLTLSRFHRYRIKYAFVSRIHSKPGLTPDIR